MGKGSGSCDSRATLTIEATNNGPTFVIADFTQRKKWQIIAGDHRVIVDWSDDSERGVQIGSHIIPETMTLTNKYGRQVLLGSLRILKI